MIDRVAVVVPWVTDEELDAWMREWGVKWDDKPTWLILQHDADLEGCGVTKNKGVARAVAEGYDVVVVLDSDCYPSDEVMGLDSLRLAHHAALTPRAMPLFQTVTDPPSRGTPYATASLTALMPVAASMGFWTGIGDYCAPRQLAHDTGPMTFRREPVFGLYFPLCGMNLAFRPALWQPWCDFIDVPRFDDIWMGWLWQREAYRRRHCFNLAGPLVRHARQSNVWKNLQLEAAHLQASETLWREIALSPHGDYDALRALLPV